MSDLSTMIKRFFLPVIFSTAVISSSAHANTIRITGPNQGVQPATSSLPELAPLRRGNRLPMLSVMAQRQTAETLWSIATRYRPNNQVSYLSGYWCYFPPEPTGV